MASLDAHWQLWSPLSQPMAPPADSMQAVAQTGMADAWPAQGVWQITAVVVVTIEGVVMEGVGGVEMSKVVDSSGQSDVGVEDGSTVEVSTVEVSAVDVSTALVSTVEVSTALVSSVDVSAVDVVPTVLVVGQAVGSGVFLATH